MNSSTADETSTTELPTKLKTTSNLSVSPTTVPSPPVIGNLQLTASPAVESATGGRTAQVCDRMAQPEDELQTCEDKCRFLYDLNFDCNYDCQY